MWDESIFNVSYATIVPGKEKVGASSLGIFSSQRLL